MNNRLSLVAMVLALVWASAAGATDVRGRADSENPYMSTPYPIARAHVYLLRSSGQWKIVASTITDEGGMYHFLNVIPGHYVVQVRGHNFPVDIGESTFQEIPPILVPPYAKGRN
jgi:hypothetical protein